MIQDSNAALSLHNAPELEADYKRVRQQSEILAAPLSAEDCCVQSMPDVSPTKWHLAHTSWFFETFILKVFVDNYQCVNPKYEYLFNSYYNGIGQQFPRPQRFLLTRPSLSDVIHYRSLIDQRMLDLLNTQHPQMAEIEQRVILGLNHEQQHQELLLTDIKHVLSHNPLYPEYLSPDESPSDTHTPFEWIGYDSGAELCGHTGEQFAFDNEGPQHSVLLRPYQLGNRLINNAEYLAFIDDKGYQRPELWLSDGWSTVQQQQWQAPLYWIQQDGAWFEFTLRGLQPLANESPVCHLSFYEADAFARWKEARLASEFELEAALRREKPLGNFVGSGLYHPTPSEGNRQLYGDCWEWSMSGYFPYPGFRPAAGAIGEYNGKFMCNQMTLRGGSCFTPRDHIRPTYRNFFYPHQRWQMTGIRLANDLL